MKKWVCYAIVCVFAVIIPLAAGANPEIPEIPVDGMVTMVDLGAKKCIPCKMMAPILVELEKEYQGRAAIVFIDVWRRENQSYVKRFGIRAIPTQIFFDKNGKEVERHTGFLDKKSIVSKFQQLGVPVEMSGGGEK